jgi:tRNA(Ile)-lysidine synthase
MSNSLVQNFLKNNLRLGLIHPNDTVLLTVSGGIDSASLFHLFIETQIEFAIAHCNFQLRGEESDGDQLFVEYMAARNNIKCFTIKFNTKEFAAENKLSIQMAARELRYNWFEKLASENHFDKIAIAHNLNDLVETFFINLTRGSGLKGLTGIKPVNGKIIRPLLFASRNEIAEYAKEKEITYREDSSNAETKYLRNAIRHKIIPEFEKLNPSFLQSVLHSSTIIGEANIVFNNQADKIKEGLIRTAGDLIFINIAGLKEKQISPEIFFEMLSEFGFRFDSVEKILKNLDCQAGLCFYSGTHKLVKDRDELIIQEIRQSVTKEFVIEEDCFTLEKPIRLLITTINNSADFTIYKNKNTATFDKAKITFPLTLRKWQEGDFFYPFGMNGRKKISDYFTDKKFSIIDKENAWLLLSGENIIWIAGHRADNRFRVTETTKDILQIELND